MVRHVAITSLCLIVFASLPLRAQTAAQIDAVVLDEMARQNIVGMAVGIVKNGEIYYTRGYGHTDLSRTIPVTADTVLRWGSISKTLTAVATLKLDEENPNFSVNDRVTKHVSYWPAHGNKANIRIKHLLSNRSGITHYLNKKNCPGNSTPDYSKNKHPSNTYNAEQAVAVFSDQKLCFDPGSGYKYSTFGFSLLGSAIEGGAGTSYVDWINDKIKTPMDMLSLRQATGTQTGYDLKRHILKEITSGNAAWKLPGGGWESNIRDLAKFANALLQGSLLKDTSRLWTTVPGNPGYGYAMFHTPDKYEVGNGGMHNNSRALLYLYPESAERLGIVLLINGIHSKPMRISHRLADLFGQHYGGRRFRNDILLRRGYSDDNFVAEWKFLRRIGYYADNIEPFVINGEVYWDAIFRNGPGGNVMLRNLDYTSFNIKRKELFEKGYHLVDIEPYVVNGKHQWAGLFRSREF